MRPYLLIALALLAAPALAQIAPSSPAQQRAANRQALRDARRTESPYKQSHLTVTPEQLKRGNTEGPPGVANTPAEKPPRASLKRPGRRR